MERLLMTFVLLSLICMSSLCFSSLALDPVENPRNETTLLATDSPSFCLQFSKKNFQPFGEKVTFVVSTSAFPGL